MSTIFEGITAYACHIARNYNAYQIATSIEGTTSNAGHAIRNDDASQITPRESIIPNISQLTVFSKCYTCQSRMSEDIILNGSHTVRNSNAC